MNSDEKMSDKDDGDKNFELRPILPLKQNKLNFGFAQPKIISLKIFFDIENSSEDLPCPIKEH